MLGRVADGGAGLVTADADLRTAHCFSLRPLPDSRPSTLPARRFFRFLPFVVRLSHQGRGTVPTELEARRILKPTRGAAIAERSGTLATEFHPCWVLKATSRTTHGLHLLVFKVIA